MNENNDYGPKGYGCFTMFVSAVAIIFSIAALLKHDNWSCEISPAGFVIATLSALITFVVAWQIWQTMASREELRRVEHIGRKYDTLSKEIGMLRELPEGFLYHTLALNHFQKEEYTWAFLHFCASAEKLIKAKADYGKHIGESLTYMDACLTNLRGGSGNIQIFLRNKQWIETNLENLSHSIVELGKWSADASGKLDHIKEQIKSIEEQG